MSPPYLFGVASMQALAKDPTRNFVPQASLRDRITQLRLAHGYTQAQIADAINVNRLAYHRMEKGAKIIKNVHLEALSKFYKTEIRP